MAIKRFVLLLSLAALVSVHCFPTEEQIRRIATGPGLGPAGPSNAVAPIPPAAPSQDLKTDSTYGYGYMYPYGYYYSYYPRYYAYGYGYPYYSYYSHYSWPYYR